ncbi:uncharacterized protein LOC117337365 [Pecten maximus]|uniref:uncharacterized protein LOC117337365 n=1 Tax=Pecten maximus TaxID=6579 RepID=UPI001458C67F|nr:uncharacterized protein LOC117337365 [Pecten maximus]XP_033754218.1 uncharacterized protein LOC117337365 [Pecten maximus]XP_033754219.1 uncharacterized protein LOC117337365 [Pecten maximus]
MSPLRYNIMVDFNVHTFIYLVVVLTAVNCFSKDTLKNAISDLRKDFGILLNADIGTFQPCDDLERKSSHVCPRIFWSPGTSIDPRKEIRIGAHFSMPFDLEIGSAMVILKVDDQPIYEDRLDFTCNMLIEADGYVPFLTECPVSFNTNISFTHTFTDVLGLKAYPGTYEAELRVKNQDESVICCKATLVIMA